MVVGTAAGTDVRADLDTRKSRCLSQLGRRLLDRLPLRFVVVEVTASGSGVRLDLHGYNSCLAERGLSDLKQRTCQDSELAGTIRSDRDPAVGILFMGLVAGCTA